MANIQSVEKRNRQRIKRRVRNLSHLTATRTLVKRAVASIEEKTENTPKAVAAAVRQLDKAAQKGVLKKETASRKISRLMKALNKTQAN